MNTSTKSTRISAVFLSAVLLAGTIIALFPSFMIGAQADSYYGMDKDNKKVDKKISVSSLKCNNINVNVNGLTLDVFPPFLGGGDMAAEAVEPSTDASSFAGSGGNDKSEFSDFRFICINNNNNTVVAAEEPVPPAPPVDECLLCFEETTQALRDAINTFLANSGEIEITTGIVIPADVNNFEELCKFLNANAPILLTEEEINDLIAGFVQATGQPIEDVRGLVDCLIRAGIIVVVPPGGENQTICHVAASGNQITLDIPANAAQAHLDQHKGPPGAGPDFAGPCPS